MDYSLPSSSVQETEAPMIALRSTLKQPKQMPRGTQVKRDRLAISVERGDTSSRITLRHLIHPQLHVQSAKDHTWEETALRVLGPRAQTHQTIMTEGPQGIPHKLPS